MTATLVRQFKSNDSYLKLVSRFPLRPIRTETQYNGAVKLVEELAVRDENSLDAGEADYLDVLSNLVSDYEDHCCPMPADMRPAHVRPAALTKEQGMTHADLAKVLGVSRPLVTHILAGKRELTKTHIYTLAQYFKLEPAYFL
jgi:HTH-type transcriptional regulator/antitoxin HigA